MTHLVLIAPGARFVNQPVRQLSARITYDDVATAADSLWVKRINVTETAVLEILGSGSPATVRKHLATWRDQVNSSELGMDVTTQWPAFVRLVKALKLGVEGDVSTVISNLELRLQESDKHADEVVSRSAQLAEELEGLKLKHESLVEDHENLRQWQLSLEKHWKKQDQEMKKLVEQSERLVRENNVLSKRLIKRYDN